MIYHVTVTVPGNYRGKTCGLCGNFNDNKADEFQLPDGKVTKNLLTFGAAWKVAVPGVFCEDGCSGERCPKCDSSLKETFERDCQIITDAYGPFAACHNRISAVSYYNDCVYDVCQAKGARSVLCQSISAYMSDCQTAGVKISNWRTPHFCPLSCPAHSHYQICAEVCATPCPGLADTITCPDSCAEACACDDGYYFNGTGCVLWDNCSCYHNGRTYKIGESVLSDNCRELCTCTAAGYVQCEDFACKASESCQVKQGSLGCFPKQCVMKAGGSFSLFSGRDGIISAMGAYEIITHCDQSAADWFRVVAKLQECSLTGLKSVVAIYVYFNDVIVTVTDKQETWVNGKKVTLPILPKTDVSVRIYEKTIVIEKNGAFQLSFSQTEEVTVTVSGSMVDKLCGACGKLAPSRDAMGLTRDTIQEYMAAFVAQDYPACGL
uniref:alpha-tectorin-like n=1 Tax=Centroberyx gerrardi TaxID=166262 RepID=UPI003AAD5D82